MGQEDGAARQVEAHHDHRVSVGQRRQQSLEKQKVVDDGRCL